MAHENELEAQLAYSFSRIAPEMIGNEYLVFGTVEKKVWQSGLKGRGHELGELLEHVADFKKVFDLKVEPGGWYPADDES